MEKAKILIVDDDPDLRQALKLRLRANQYDTVHAVDGYSAIALAYKEHPQLIILDLGLPAGDGFVVLDRLQKDDKLSGIPVIVLTARDAPSSDATVSRASRSTRTKRASGSSARISGTNSTWPGVFSRNSSPDWRLPTIGSSSCSK